MLPSDMTVKTKLIAGMCIPIILTSIIGLIVYTNINSMRTTSHWVTHTHKVLGKADSIIASAVDMETGMRGFLLAGKDNFLEPYVSGEERVYKYFAELRHTVSDNPPQVQRLHDAENTIREWQANVTEPMISLRRKVGTSITMEKIVDVVGQAKGKTYFDAFRAIMADFKAIEEELVITREAQNDSTAAATKNQLVIGLSLSALIVALLAFFIIRDLLSKLGGEPAEVSAITANIADGDLSFELNRKAPAGSLYTSMKVMMESLRNTVSDIQDMANNVETEAQQTSTIARQTSESTLTQLNETTQVATSVEQMSATVKEVSNNVATVASASEDAQSRAVKGRQAMAQTVNQMNELNTDIEQAAEVIQDLELRTNEINSIIEVIRGVAEQTNLLALNAAIEAARAGEQGRGFAVVADEVRTLAERTQKSTEEINQMIEKLQHGVSEAVSVMNRSQAKADDASKQALSTDESLNSIQESVNNINDMNTQIATATEEQSTVVDEISRNISRFHDMSESTSRDAKVAAETGVNLFQLSQSLQKTVKHFKM